MPVIDQGQTSVSTVPLLINGKDVYTSEKFQVISPKTSELAWEVSSATVHDASSAVEAAVRAFPAWSATTPSSRRGIFMKAADVLDRRADECKEYMSTETGALPPFAGFNLNLSAEMLREIAGRISTAMSGSVPVCQEEGTHALVLKEPYGVVLGISPWNAPYILGLRSIAYALAAGNTCILKGSEVSPRCFWAIGSVFKEAGLPDGCLNVIYHRPEDAAAVTASLIANPAVKKINFTGSTGIGKVIAETAGRHLKPVLMELGGKASAIICDDANLENAAAHCARGALLHSGQICMATERILVHKTVLKPFIQAIKAATSDIFGAESTVVAQSMAVEKNHKLFKDAFDKGASLIHGEFKTTQDSKYKINPLIIGNVTKDMDLYYTESFGPSVSIIAVESDEEAIAVANDTEYGLSGAVFTDNLARGLNMARKIESGAVHINSMSVHDEASLPHGGVKQSGWGRFNGQMGLDEFLKTKTITFKAT